MNIPGCQAAMEQQKERSRAALREQQVLTVDLTKGRWMEVLWGNMNNMVKPKHKPNYHLGALNIFLHVFTISLW